VIIDAILMNENIASVSFFKSVLCALGCSLTLILIFVFYENGLVINK